MRLELRGQVIATHPGGIGERTDRDRAVRSLQTPACVLDQDERARRCLGKSRSQFLLHYPKCLGGAR
jgi:hypothetical protein